MKGLLIIWGAVVVVTGFNIGYVSAYIDSRTQEVPVSGRVLQNAERGTKLQPTVSGAYLQWGHNPQQTIKGKELQGSEPVLQGS